MFKGTIVAGLLALTAAAPALAHRDYRDDWVDARVIRVEPQLSFSYSNWGGDDAFRILYEWGGHQYWTSAPHRPHGWIRVRPPRGMHHYNAPRYRHDRHHDYRHDYRHDGRHEDRHEHNRRHRDRDGGHRW